MPYPVSVYSWNRYLGQEPTVTSTGLPLEFAAANLPLQVPADIPPSDDLPYSPVLLEQGVGPTIKPPAELPDTPTAQQVQAAPAKTPVPPFWQMVSRAVFGGNIPLNSANSTGAIASGSSKITVNI